jgi:hypothetical protein
LGNLGVADIQKDRNKPARALNALDHTSIEFSLDPLGF